MSEMNRVLATALVAALLSCQNGAEEEPKTIAVYRGKAAVEAEAGGPDAEAGSEKPTASGRELEPEDASRTEVTAAVTAPELAPAEASAATDPTASTQAPASAGPTTSTQPTSESSAPAGSSVEPEAVIDPCNEISPPRGHPIPDATHFDTKRVPTPTSEESVPSDSQAPDADVTVTSPVDAAVKEPGVASARGEAVGIVDAGAVAPPVVEPASFDPVVDAARVAPTEPAPARPWPTVAELDRAAFLPGGLSMRVSAFQSGDHPTDLDEVALGRMLFFDPRLSRDGSTSCASCHDVGFGFSDGQTRARGFAGAPHVRHTPSLYHAGTATVLGWDGASDELEDMTSEHLLDPQALGGGDVSMLVDRVASIDGYALLFQRCDTEPGVDSIVEALSAFVRTLAPSGSAFDRYCYGELDALEPIQKQGLALFVGKANCVACHQGANFDDGKFHDHGLARGADRGRFEVTGREADRHCFRTPNLRDATRTAPYFHDGSAKSLREVVDFYDRGGGDEGRPDLPTLGLSEDEKIALVAFLESLTGTPPQPVVPELPEDL